MAVVRDALGMLLLAVYVIGAMALGAEFAKSGRDGTIRVGSWFWCSLFALFVLPIFVVAIVGRWGIVRMRRSAG
jgi:hypothetical protein